MTTKLLTSKLLSRPCKRCYVMPLSSVEWFFCSSWIEDGVTTHKSNPKNENQIQFSFESIDLSASKKITLDVKRPHLTSTKLQYMAHDTHETQSTAILHADDNEPPFKQNWSYYSLTNRKVEFSCFKFKHWHLLCHPSMYTMVSKYLTITWCSPFTQIGKYLKKTATKGIALAFWPNGNHSFHAMRDTDLVRTWCKANANTRSSYLNRTGSVIMYSLIPIIWHYKVRKLMFERMQSRTYCTQPMCLLTDSTMMFNRKHLWNLHTSWWFFIPMQPTNEMFVFHFFCHIT